MERKDIMALLLFVVGTFLTCKYSNFGTFVGVFLILWANNISFAEQLLKKGK